jgi:hypothetical protein
MRETKIIMSNTATAKIIKYAYWVNVIGKYAGFEGVVKVDFEVTGDASTLRRLLSAATSNWTPTQSWLTQIVSWNPVISQNEYEQETKRAE